MHGNRAWSNAWRLPEKTRPDVRGAASTCSRPDAIEAVHDQAMRILEEIGVEVGSEAVIDLLRDAGQTRRGHARAARPRLRDGAGREGAGLASRCGRATAAREVHVGGGSMVLTPVGGSPFCSDLERGRRDGTLDAYVELTQMAHAADVIDCLQSGVTEAADLSEISRYLDLDYACLRWSDKPYVCYGTAGEKAEDAVDDGGDRVRRPRRDRRRRRRSSASSTPTARWSGTR